MKERWLMSTAVFTAMFTLSFAQDVPSGPPAYFDIHVDITSLTCAWSPPDTLQNGVIVSYTLTCTSNGETVVDLTLNPIVFEMTIDLFTPSTTYVCSVAASTATGIGPYTTPISVTTEDLESPKLFLPFIPLGVEYGSITVFLPETDDGTSYAIFIPNSIGFPFGDSLQTHFFIGTNGLISFGAIYNFPSAHNFPLFPVPLYLVAPFWADVDISGGNGDISYEIYDSGYFLDHVSAYIRRQKPSLFQGTWMAVAYWNAVHPYEWSGFRNEENTFQAILITDGLSSYAIFTYKCNLLKWGIGSTIGFNDPGGNYDNHDPTYPDIGCVNQPASNWSNIVYLLSSNSFEFDTPRNVTVSNITENSACLSWTVPSVTEPQKYYLWYGTNQNYFNFTTDKIQGNSNISLVNMTYSIHLQNLDRGTAYYVIVVAEFGTIILYSNIKTFTTIEPAPDGPPLNFTVTADRTSLSLLWLPPAGHQTLLSYTVSCSVAGVVRVYAQLKPTLGITFNYLEPSTDYYCTVYANSSGGAGPTTEEIVASTESETRNDIILYLTFIPMGTTYGVDEVFLAETDDGTSDAIPISIDFPFGQSIQDEFYVGTNGLLSFDIQYNSWYTEQFPGHFIGPLYLVAPFWNDINIRGGNGKISYEIHQSGYFLQEVNTYLNRKRPSGFQGTWMAVVYYDAVHSRVNTDLENTFQAILITDGTYTYTIFTYQCGLMEWDNGAIIGFTAAGNPYKNYDLPPSEVACVNTPYTNWSNVEYLLSNENPEIPVPQDIVVSEITTENASVSWTIPQFTRPELYYIQYGTQENMQHMKSDSIMSSTDTSLLSQRYSILLEGLNSDTEYYLRVVAVFDVFFIRYSDTISFRTYDQEKIIYLPFLNHTDTYIDSGVLESCDDCSSTEIEFPYGLPFGGYFHWSAYVQTNGLISFGQSLSNSVPVLFPSTSADVFWSYLVAPFWADLSTTLGGSVSWQILDIAHTPEVFDQVNMFIQNIKDVNFNGTWMLVAFWKYVGQYANTFQAIIITDGRKSYSIYTYKCGDLFWPESAIIGFNAPLMDFINDPHSGNSAHIIACIHFSSLWSNIVYDLQPGSVILPTTPEPSSFTGSCVKAGHTHCCFDCLGFPPDCYCSSFCEIFGNCCYDFVDICPNAAAPPPYDLLVAIGHSLVSVHYQGTDSSIVRTNYSENTIAVDFNYEQLKVYWSHTDLNVPATIHSANMDGTNEQVLVHTDLLFVSDIAVDWVAGNLYWVDSSWARIEAMNLENLNRTQILQTGPNTNPSAIAVDPLRRYMFWSDLGVTAQIERAFMDGSKRHVIIYTDLSRPVGLTLDYSEQRIYWSDVDLYRLEYCNYDGTSRYIVETEVSGLLYPYALTVADDLLFWTDWATDSVYATHKEHGSNDANGYFQTVASFSSNPYGIEALLDGRQEPGVNSCEDSPCTHVCLLSSDDPGYVCACPEGHILESDGFTCKALNNFSTNSPVQGSCVDAGYISCCTHGYCAGYPPTCFCHPDCTVGIFSCCSDFADICPSVPPLQPTNLIAYNVYSTSAQLNWTIPRATFGFETYFVRYGLSPEVLDMQSDIVVGSSVQNGTYSITILNLQPLTTYFHMIVATNIAGETVSDIESFTTWSTDELMESQMTSSIEVPPESTITSTSVLTIDTESPPQSAPVTSTPNTVVISIASTTTVVNQIQTESPSTPMQLSTIPKTATPTTTPDKSKIPLVIIENSVKITLVETNVNSKETATPKKMPAVITENSVKITLVQYNKTNFDRSVQQNFKMATAEVVTSYCAKDSCSTIKLKRETLCVESNDVMITDISNRSMNVSFLTYVMLNGDEVLDGNSLLSAIQNGHDFYQMYNFSSVIVELIGADTRKNEKKGLFGGIIAGIVISLLLVVAAVVVIAVYCIRKKRFYLVSRPVGGFENPVTDRLFELDENTPAADDDDDVKINPHFKDDNI